MICAFCGKKTEKYTLASLFLEKDILCGTCRRQLKVHKNYVDVDSLRVETFYDYDGIFRSLLIQYKECFDEALAETFLYLIKDYIKYKYFGYKMILMPSSRTKLEQRGFHHLQLIYEPVGLKIVDGLTMKQELVQEGKNLEDRRKMVDNYVYEGPRLKKVLIVDDVLTSGSSMMGAYKALEPYCENIKAICLAHKTNNIGNAFKKFELC